MPIAVYLDGIQSDLAYLFQEGIARDEAVMKENEVAKQSPLYRASVHSLEDAPNAPQGLGLAKPTSVDKVLSPHIAPTKSVGPRTAHTVALSTPESA